MNIKFVTYLSKFIIRKIFGQFSKIRANLVPPTQNLVLRYAYEYSPIAALTAELVAGVAASFVGDVVFMT